jgi:hypothetical protein
VQATHTEFLPQTNFRNTGRNVVWEVNDTHAYERGVAESSSDELQLSHLPVRSITSLYLDYDGRAGTRVGAFGVETLKVLGTDYWPNFDGVDSLGQSICRDGIIRSQGRWPDMAGSVKVTYVAGYTTQELHGQDSVINAMPILEAVIDEAVRRVIKQSTRKKNRFAGFVGPLTSESMGDYSYSSNGTMLDALAGAGADLLPETQEKIAEFCRMDMGVL